MSQFIAYGDCVFLTFPQNKQDPLYYIHGKSIIDPLVTSVSARDLLRKGFRNCIFQIFPKNSHFLADELNTTTDSFQEAWRSLLQEGIKRHIGRPVLHGDFVHLLHVETRSFLAVEILNKNDNSIQTSRIFLTQDISQEKTCFHFETVSNYFYPGEKISYKSPILVKHIHTDQYLTFLTEERKNSFMSTNSASMLSLGPSLELCMNPLPLSMVEIAPYCDPIKSQSLKDSNAIVNGDFVRIYDSRLIRENLEVHKFYLEPKDYFMAEEEDFLILSYYTNNSSQFSNNRDSRNYSTNSLSALNIFQIINSEELEQPESSIKLLPKSFYQEKIKFPCIKKPYLLKHVLSSSFVTNLTACGTKAQIKIDLKSKDNLEYIEKYQLSLFKLAGHEGTLIVNANFLIGTYSAQREELLFIAQSTEEDPERVVKTIAANDKVAPSEPNVIYYKDERVLAENYKTFFLKWDSESNLSESLRCEKVSEDELYDLNFFVACQELLNDLNTTLQHDLKTLQKDQVDCFAQIIGTVGRIKDITIKILLYLTGRKLDGQYIHDEKFIPSILKQNYLKELKIIETLNGTTLKLSLVAAHYRDLPITSDKVFEDLITYFTYLLKLYTLNNPANTNDLMRSVKIYLRPELLQRLTSVVTEVLTHSEFAPLNFIMEVLKLFIYDKTSNNFANYSPHSELSVKILKILIAVANFKSFCIALQRYRNFWSPQFIASVFPKFRINHGTNVLEVFYKDDHLMNLIDITSENSLSVEANYVMSALNLIIILARKLPNFQRLYSAIKDFIPYEVCLSVVKYNDPEIYCFTIKKMFLNLIVHFHFKHFVSQALLWPHQFIRASNSNLPTYPEMEPSDQMPQSTNSLPQKLTLINIYNMYNKKLQALVNEKYSHDKGKLQEILDILRFSLIFFKNGIIEFPDKKPFMILYQGYSNLNKKVEEHLSQDTKIGKAEEVLVAEIRHQFQEIQISITQAIETFFGKEYLLFLRYKYSSNEELPPKTLVQNMQAALHNSRSLENVSRNEIQQSKSEGKALLEKSMSAVRKPSITKYITSTQKSDEFIEVALDGYKFEEDLRDFLVAWDASLEPYALGIKQILTAQLGYIDDDKINFINIVSLEQLASRFKLLVQQLKNILILETNTEVMDIIQMYNSLKGISELIESFAKDNSINNQLFDNAEDELRKVLNQFGIDTTVVQNANITDENVLTFIIENPSVLQIKTLIEDLENPQTCSAKYQDAMRILNLYDKLLDILDYFITSTNEYFMPRTLRCRLYVIQLLLYFIQNHPTNCKTLHKLLVTAYFYEIYSGKIYSQDVVVYLQVLLASLYQNCPDLLKNENEVKRLVQIFYEPYLRAVIELNDKYPTSFPVSPSKSPVGSTQKKFMFTGLTLNNPIGSADNLSVSYNSLMVPSPRLTPHMPSKHQVRIQALLKNTNEINLTLSVPLKKTHSNSIPASSHSSSRYNSPRNLQPPDGQASDKVDPLKYQKTLLMCSFTLNSIQAFFKTTSKPLLARYQGYLQDIFFLNSEIFTHYINETNKYEFENDQLESVWLRFYEHLLRSCTEFAAASNPMQEYLLSTFGTMFNLNSCVLNMKKHHPYNLKVELIRLGILLFSSFQPSEENEKAKIEFLFIMIYEAFLYIKYQLCNSQSDTDLASKDIFQKVKVLKIWEDIKNHYGANLIEKLENISANANMLIELGKIHDQLEENVFGNIIKFFKHLFKYDPPFCLRKLDIANSSEKLGVLDVLMGVLNEILEVSKLYGDQEKINIIKSNLLSEVKNNKDYGKFHHQIKIIDFLLAFKPTILINGTDIHQKTTFASVSNTLANTIERFLSEENVKTLENDSLALLVKGIEDHPMSEKILRQILGVVASEQYANFSKESYRFFCLLLLELLRAKIQTLKDRIVEFEYRMPHIKVIQNMFSHYNFTEFIFKNMGEANEESLVIFLEMANFMLYGGYKKIQKIFFKCFMTDSENTLVLRLSAQLKKVFERYLRKEKIRNSANQMLLVRKKLKNDHLKHKDDADSLFLSNILRFIHLLCEGHNTEFQQFFKEQNHEKKLNSISINFPIDLSYFIGSFTEVCNYYSYSIGHQLFGALIEIVQGDCRDIIYEICSRTDIINNILVMLTRYQPGSDLYKSRRFEGNNIMETLKSDAINLLLSIVESSDSRTKHIIAEEIDYNLLIKATLNFITTYFKKTKVAAHQDIDILLKIRDEQFIAQGGLSDGLNLLIIIKVLQRSSNHFKTELLNQIQECDEAIRDDFQFYMEELGGKFIQSIEILDSSKDLRKIYFSKLPSCFYLDQQMKDVVIEKIDRTGYHVKISEFLGDFEAMYNKMKIQMDVAMNPRFMMITQLYPRLKKSSYMLAYVINMMIMFYFGNEDLDIIYADSYLRWNSYLYVLLNFVQLIFSLAILVVWFGTTEPKFYMMKKWSSFVKANLKRSKPITYEEEQRWNLKPESVTVQEFIRILELKGPNAKELKDSKGLNLPEVQYEYGKHTLRFLFASGKFINNLTYVLNCWLSLVVHPIFCSLQLLNSLAESKIMQSVISSFVKNGKEIGVAMGGSVIIVFIYSLVGFFFLRNSFMVEGYENVCTTIWHCFISLLDFGMRSGGGIGDVLTHESYINGNTKIYTGRWFYDISFYFLIIVVMLNLIFGIVIDTFGDIRSEKIENKKDQTGKCFICDIDRGMLERVGSGFEEHTASEHHMWNYIFYLIHLKTKGTIYLSEIEDYVYNCFKNKDFSWIPYKKALSMKGKGGEDELERDLDDIKDKMQKIESKLDTIFQGNTEKKNKNY